jgi:tRNA1(Val) A37 N6-methylase TrmN6
VVIPLVCQTDSDKVVMVHVLHISHSVSNADMGMGLGVVVLYLAQRDMCRGVGVEGQTAQ